MFLWLLECCINFQSVFPTLGSGKRERKRGEKCFEKLFFKSLKKEKCLICKSKCVYTVVFDGGFSMFWECR